MYDFFFKGKGLMVNITVLHLQPSRDVIDLTMFSRYTSSKLRLISACL